MVLTASTFNNILDRFGSPYQVRVGSVTFSDYGDGSVTWALFTNPGYISILTERDIPNQGGILNVGDAKGYFKTAAAFVPGSVTQVLHQGVYWEMFGDPITYQISGDTLVKEVNLRKTVS